MSSVRSVSVYIVEMAEAIGTLHNGASDTGDDRFLVAPCPSAMVQNPSAATWLSRCGPGNTSQGLAYPTSYEGTNESLIEEQMSSRGIIQV